LDQTCAALFCWELEGFGPRLVTLDNIEAFERLCAEVQGNVDRIADTEASRAIYGSYEALQLVIRLRALARKKYYKGIVATKGKVTFVQFGSKLSPEEDKFLEENLLCLKGLLASSSSK